MLSRQSARDGIGSSTRIEADETRIRDLFGSEWPFMIFFSGGQRCQDSVYIELKSFAKLAATTYPCRDAKTEICG